MSNNLVNTKTAAKVLGISLASVNYYTNLGLLKVTDRKGNMRLYDKNEITGIFDTIQRLRKEGYPLRLIQQRLNKGYNI